MDFITGSKALLGLIVALATQAGLPPEMVLAIIEAESGGNPYATAFNPNAAVKMQLKRPAICSEGTDGVHQRTAWGVMQVMGLTARGLGFEGWLPELVEPEINIRLGVAYLAELKKRFFAAHGLDGVIAAYRKGSPRKTSEGKFLSQGYVDRIKQLMPKYKSVVEPLKAELTELDAVAASAAGETPPENETAAVGAETNAAPEKTTGSENDGETAVNASPDDALAAIPTREELETYVDARSRDELLAIAKGIGVRVAASAKDKTITEKLKAELGAREDIAAIMAEMNGLLGSHDTSKT